MTLQQAQKVTECHLEFTEPDEHRMIVLIARDVITGDFVESVTVRDRQSQREFAIKDIVGRIYRKRRLEVIRQAQWRCRNCGVRGPLQAHHVQYRSHQGTHTESNLQALCQSCHERTHQKGKHVNH